MIMSDAFSLRQLIRLHNYCYDEKIYKIREIFQESFANQRVYISLAFEFMISVFGGTDSFVEALKRTEFSKSASDEHILKRLVADLAMVFEYKNNKLRDNQEFMYDDLDIRYRIASHSFNPYDTVIFARLNTDGKVDWLDNLDLNKLLLGAFSSYLKLKGEAITV
jgi:hypothetical protein